MSWTPTAAPVPWVGEIHPTSPRPPLGSGHRALGHALTVLLAASVGAAILKMMLDLYGLTLFARWEADPANIVVADGETFDLMDLGLSGLEVLLMLVTGIVTMTWLYQAYGSREADPALLPFKRWWTIGGWLIPVVWLVRPFELMRDLYRATADAQPQGQPGANTRFPQRFRWWWGCWLATNILGTIAFRTAAPDPDLSQVVTAVQLDLVIEVMTIAAALLFIGVLRSITSNLWQRANSSY